MPDINQNADHLTDKAVAWDAIAAKNAIIASQAAEISRLRDALKPFAGDKLPGNNRDHVEYDRYGLRRIMSDMEIARRNAFFALYPEEHPLAKAAARNALEANHG